MSDLKKVKPFVKWAGGKTQILSEIRKLYPDELGKSMNKYAEPFVGGGAVLFDILSNYDMEEIYISDINRSLINTYLTIRDNVDSLISLLGIYERDFIAKDIEERKEYFINNRKRFNEIKRINDNKDMIESSALFIFLNKTCFNGLYRVNKKGEFNVPMGSYKNPCICDIDNLFLISDLLRNVNIVCADYKQSVNFIDKNTFVYIDPPYRPLNETSGFNSYNEVIFDDNEQILLAKYVDKLSNIGAKVLASNSDPKNVDIEDNFFDDLYKKHKISRINAKRMINSKGNLRGNINELLICNF